MHRLALLLVAAALLAAESRVLVYTRNYTPDGKGYVHDNIATSVEAIRELGREHGFAVEHSEDPAVFTPDNLKRYRAVVFSNSNNEAFATDEQRQAFQQYVRAGGGFAGIHSATGSERTWPYFWNLIGGKFVRHPKLQPFTVRVADAGHAATRELPATFEWEDECYYFDNVSAARRILLVTDAAGIDDPKKPAGEVFPLAWAQSIEGGRQFYTALGHKKEHYADPVFRKHLAGGILWVMGDRK